MNVSDALATMSLIFIGLAVILIPLELIARKMEKKDTKITKYPFHVN